MDETWEEILGNDKPDAKTLFKLIAREGRVTSEDASQLLGTDRRDVDSWVRLLLGKKFIIAEGTASNPILRLSDEIIARSGERAFGAAQRDAGNVPFAPGERELERKLRNELEDGLKDSEHIIDGLQAELLQEKKEKTYLEERLRFMEMKGGNPASADAVNLGIQLERERAERMKLEELLKRKQEDLDSLRQPEKKSAEATLEPALEEEMPQNPDEKKPLRLKRWSQAAGGDYIKTAEKRVPMEKAEPVEADLGTTKAVEPQEKDAAALVRLLLEKGAMKNKEAASQLSIDEKALTAWIEDLKSRGALEVRKHLFGGWDIALKNGVDTESLISELHAQKLRDELRRLREAK
jgi:hypothetical protein